MEPELLDKPIGLSTGEAKQEKLLHLEGWRGVLALVVFIHHFILLFYPTVYVGTFDYREFMSDPYAFKILLAHSPLNVFMSGHLAVCVFLAISGYVFTYAYRNSNDFGVLQRNTIRRYFRLILPVVAACLFLKLLFVGGLVEMANYPRHVQSLEFGSRLFVQEFSLLQVLHDAFYAAPFFGKSNFLPVLWTVQAEFLGVLCLQALWMLSHNLRSKAYMGLLFLLICLFCSRHLFMIVLAGGMVCFYEKQLLNLFKTAFSKILLLLFALFFGGMLNTDKEAIAHSMYSFTLLFPGNAYPYFHLLSAVLILVLIVSSKKMKWLFSRKYFVSLGKLCFSIYLLHLPILYCLGSRLMWLSEGRINPLLLFVICFSVTLLLAIPFYRYVDKLGIRLSDKLAAYLLKPHAK